MIFPVDSSKSWSPRASRSLTALALGLCVLLANCGSARPVKYYTMEGMPSTTTQTSPSAYPITLVVGHITAPLLYRDDRIVFSNGQVQLGTDNFNRWAEQPTEMLESMLVQNLRSSGQYRAVQRQTSSARGDYIIRGRLSSLCEVDSPGINARFAIEFDLYQPKTSMVVWTFPYAHDEPVSGKTMAEVVTALQANVRAGLQQATSSLGQWFASHPPTAQTAAQ